MRIILPAWSDRSCDISSLAALKKIIKRIQQMLSGQHIDGVLWVRSMIMILCM